MTARAFAALAGILASGAAAAHAPVENVAGAAAGFLHPLATPAHLLVAITLGLLLGQSRALGRAAGRRTVTRAAIFAAGVVLGLAGPGSGAAAPPPHVLALLGALAGVLVVAAAPLPGWFTTVLLAASGVALGLDSYPGVPLTTAVSGAILLGVVAPFAGALVIGAVARARPLAIGVRVVASWAAASAVLVLSLSLAGVFRGGDDPAGGRPVMIVTSYPLAWFTRTLAGDAVRVVLPEMPDQKHYWVPAPALLARMRAATLVVTDNRHADHWLDHLSPWMDHVLETVGPEAATAAPNPWLDQGLALVQAAAIRDALERRALVPAERLTARWAALEAEIRSIDAALQAAATRVGDRPLLVWSDGYAHLAAGYDLRIWGFAWDPRAPLDGATLEGLEALLRVHPARVMLWPRTPSDHNVERLAAIGVASAVFDPLHQAPASGDYPGVMRANAATLAAIGDRR